MLLHVPSGYFAGLDWPYLIISSTLGPLNKCFLDESDPQIEGSSISTLIYWSY